MIEPNDKKTIETNIDTTKESAFSIANNAKMYRLLSDKLYSNKIKAVIRELSTNAVDANIDNNLPNEPILVHLPNEIEPWFSVKDSGKGLLPKEMELIFASYGNSTKTNSNLMVGSLGLGSKSPFAYVDSYSVISSTSDGYMRSYNCYMNEKGEPQLLLVGEKESHSDSSTGLEVKFPVQKEDFDEFRREAEIVYRSFDVKPKVVGNSRYEVKSFKKEIVSGNSWKLLETNHWRDIDTQIAVMGGIEYPIRRDKIYDKIDNNLKYILDLNYVVYFGLGEIEYTPSREELEYKNHTVNKINSMFKVIDLQLEQNYLLKLEKQPTYFQALKFNKKFLESAIRGKTFKGKWKGKELQKIVDLWKYDYKSVIKYYYKNYSSTISRTELTNSMQVPDENDIIVLNDLKNKSALSKARSLVTKDVAVYLVEETDNPKNLLFEKQDVILASEIEVKRKKVQEQKLRNLIKGISIKDMTMILMNIINGVEVLVL